MNRVERTLFHTFIYGVGIVLNRGVAFLLIPIYARVLSPTEIALWDVCTVTVLFLVPLFQMGLPAAVMRYYYDTEEQAERAASFATSFYFSCGVWLLVGILSVLFAGPLAAALLNDDTRGDLLVLVVLVSIATTLGAQPLAILRARERSFLYSMLDFSRAIVGPIAIILLVVVWRKGVPGILAGELIGILSVAALAIGFHLSFLKPHLDTKTLKGMLAYGLPLVPVTIASAVTLMSDRYFLVRMIGPDEMAVYSLGFRVAMVMAVVSRAFQTGWPSSALILANEENAQEVFAKFLRWLLAGAILMSVALAAIAPELIALIAPQEQYASAFLIVPWVGLSYCLYTGVYYVLTTLLIVRKTLYSTYVLIVGAALKIGLNFIFIPLALRWSDGDPVWASIAAALTTLVVYIVELALSFYAVRNAYPVPYDFRKIAALIVLVLIVLTALAYLGTIETLWSPAIRLLLIPTFALALWSTGIVTTQELREGRDKLHARFRQLRSNN